MVEDFQFIAQPLNGRACNEDGAFEGVDGLPVRPAGERGEELF